MKLTGSHVLVLNISFMHTKTSIKFYSMSKHSVNIQVKVTNYFETRVW
jgi:hypothetical protein